MRNLFVILFVVLLLIGCENIKNVFETQQAIDSGKAANTIVSGELNDVEKIIVTHAINAHDQFQNKWKSKSVIENFDEFANDFASIQNQYTSVSNIVKAHWSAYSDDQKSELLGYQAAAENMEKAYNNLVRVKNLKTAGEVALKYGLLAAQLAGKL